MANPNNKYAVAAKAVLEELGGAPVRSGILFKTLVNKGLVEDTINAYNYTLKACKENSVFDTSKRGHIGLAPAEAVVEQVQVAYLGICPEEAVFDEEDEGF